MGSYFAYSRFSRGGIKGTRMFNFLISYEYTVPQLRRWHESVKVLAQWKAKKTHFNPSYSRCSFTKSCVYCHLWEIWRRNFHRNTSNHSEPFLFLPLQLMCRFLREKSRSFWILWLVPRWIWGLCAWIFYEI